jgi:hypothetical protein
MNDCTRRRFPINQYCSSCLSKVRQRPGLELPLRDSGPSPKNVLQLETNEDAIEPVRITVTVLLGHS